MAFPEPEKLELARRAAHHVAFSWGPHQCIGQQLARIWPVSNSTSCSAPCSVGCRPCGSRSTPRS
ncbi:hypothetical protein ACFV2U_42465 [Streptomyces sp. NPDC059697]|uniref:hypothetical protein n=1 Tax=Streptomyces sp. NPDC059697 TaxID=3346912 RepID=UPI0036C54FF7